MKRKKLIETLKENALLGLPGLGVKRLKRAGIESVEGLVAHVTLLDETQDYENETTEYILSFFQCPPITVRAQNGDCTNLFLFSLASKLAGNG